jgi:hypothetical protein
MTELRECAQCGRAFTPQREHARFCSATCRMAWNRERVGVAAAPAVAIDWSVTALTEAVARFEWAGSWDLPRTAAAVSETAWWITLLDATLVRYHPRDYESTLSRLTPGQRRKTEETLAGLRYVRNLLGRSVDPADLISPAPGGAGSWTWNPQPEPELTEVPDRTREWEMNRYRAYQVRLAGHEVAPGFALCAGFLEQAAALATAGQVPSANSDTKRG